MGASFRQTPQGVGPMNCLIDVRWTVSRSIQEISAFASSINLNRDVVLFIISRLIVLDSGPDCPWSDTVDARDLLEGVPVHRLPPQPHLLGGFVLILVGEEGASEQSPTPSKYFLGCHSFVDHQTFTGFPLWRACLIRCKRSMTTTWRTYSRLVPTACPTSSSVRRGSSAIIPRILSRLGLIPLPL